MLLLIFKITTFLIPLAAFILGIYSLAKNPRSRVVFLWFLMSMAVGTWGLGLFILLLVNTEAAALLCNFTLYTGATLIPILFYHFVSVFLLRQNKDKLFIILGYIIAGFFLILVFNPPWLIGGVSSKTGFKFWVDAGTLYIPFVIYFWIYVIVSIYPLITNYRKSDGFRKKQIFYILLASLIGFLGGGTTFLPQLFNIYPFGNFFTFLYPLLITYGIFLKEN